MDPLTSQCTATSKRSGQRCRRLVVGGGVCAMHGGAAPQVAAAREGRVIAARARLAGDAAADVDPHGALLAALTDADAVLQALKASVATGQMSGLDTFGAWIDRTARLAALAVSSGLAESRQRLAESEADVLVAVIAGVLGDLRLDTRQQGMVPRVVPKWLRAAADGSLSEVQA